MINAGWARIRPRLTTTTAAVVVAAPRNDVADAILQAWRHRQTTPPSTWAQLQTRLLASADRTDSVPLCRAVHALAKLGFASPGLLDHVAGRCLHLPPVSSSFLVDLADTFGRAGRFDRDLFRTVSLRLATPSALVGRLSPCRASTLLYACARVGFADPHLFAFVAADLLAHVDVMSVAFMSRLVWALARTRMASCSDASIGLARAMLARLQVVFTADAVGTGSTTIVTDIMWAYAIVADAIGRRAEARQLVVQLAQHVHAHLCRTSPHSLASFLWAAGALQADIPGDVLQSAADHAAANVAGYRSNSCIAITAWAVARLRFKHDDLFAAVAALPPERWVQFRPGDLNMTASALAPQNDAAGRYDCALLHIAQAALDQLDRFRPGDLCQLLCALGQGLDGARRRAPLFDRAARLLERDLDLLNTNERAMLLSALLDGRDDDDR